jgi:hypothetical protein
VPEVSADDRFGGQPTFAGWCSNGKNRRTLAVLEQAAAEDLELPLPRLLRRMNDPLLDERYRDALAAIAAPYCHAKQAIVTRLKRLTEMTDAELDQQIAPQKIAGQTDVLPAQRRCMGKPHVGSRLSYRTQMGHGGGHNAGTVFRIRP